MPARIWLCCLLPPWKGNGSPIYTFKFQAQNWSWDCIGYCHKPCPPMPSLKGSPSTGFWDGCWDECPSWYHHLCLAQWHRGSPMPTTSLLATPWVTRCWRWSGVLYRSHHQPSSRKGEGPWYSAPITPRHYQNILACLWLCFLAWYQQDHWGICLAMWNRYEIQAKNAPTPLTPTPSHPWWIWASDIFTLDGVDYLILADFYSKVILVPNPPTGQSNSAKAFHILEEWLCDHGMPEVLCTDNDHSMLVLPLQIAALNWVSPMKLQSTLPTVPWLCGVMCQNSHAYTAACQVQWYKSKDCTTAPQGHWSWCQTSPTLSDAVQLQDMYHHTILDLQYWPSSPTGSRAPWGPSWACQVLCW